MKVGLNKQLSPKSFVEKLKSFTFAALFCK